MRGFPKVLRISGGDVVLNAVPGEIGVKDGIDPERDGVKKNAVVLFQLL